MWKKKRRISGEEWKTNDKRNRLRNHSVVMANYRLGGAAFCLTLFVPLPISFLVSFGLIFTLSSFFFLFFSFFNLFCTHCWRFIKVPVVPAVLPSFLPPLLCLFSVFRKSVPLCAAFVMFIFYILFKTWWSVSLLPPKPQLPPMLWWLIKLRTKLKGCNTRRSM